MPTTFRYGTVGARYGSARYGATASSSSSTTIVGVVGSSALGLIGLSLNVSPSVAGVVGTSHLGSTSETGTAIFTLSSAYASSVHGTVIAGTSVSIIVSGITTTSHAGPGTENGTANLLIPGDYVTSHVGVVHGQASTSPLVVGQSSTTHQGILLEFGAAIVHPLGSIATGHVASLSPSANISVDVSGRQGTTHLGMLAIGRFITAPISGVQASATHGSLLETGTCLFTMQGSQSRALPGYIDPSRPFNISGVQGTSHCGTVASKGSSDAPINLGPLTLPFQPQYIGPDFLRTFAGTIIFESSTVFTIASVSATAQVGVVVQAPNVNVNVSLSGISTSGQIGGVNNGFGSLTGVVGTSQIGPVVQSNTFPAGILGVQLHGIVQNLYPRTSATAALNGSFVTAHAGNPRIQATAYTQAQGVRGSTSEGTVYAGASANEHIIGVEGDNKFYPAAGYLAFDYSPYPINDGDTVIIGPQTYTFRYVMDSVPGTVLISDFNSTMQYLVDGVNGIASPGVSTTTTQNPVASMSGSFTHYNFTSRLAGMLGNSIVLQINFSFLFDYHYQGFYGGTGGFSNVSGTSNQNLASFQLEAQQGSLSESGNENVVLRTVQGLTSLGSSTVQADSNELLPSIQGTSYLGSVIAEGSTIVGVTGLFLASYLGDVSTSSTCIVHLPDLRAFSHVGTLSIVASASVYSQTVQCTIHLGSLSPHAGAVAHISGVQSQSLIGTIHGGATVFAHAFGVQSDAQLGNIRVVAHAAPPPVDDVTFLRLGLSKTNFRMKPGTTFLKIIPNREDPNDG